MKDAQPRPFHIRSDRELVHPQVMALLREHLAGMHAKSPPDKVHALDLSGLRTPEITFLTAPIQAAIASKDNDGELLAKARHSCYPRSGCEVSGAKMVDISC